MIRRTALVLTVCLVAFPASAGEIDFRSEGISFVDLELLPLPDGSSAQTYVAQTVMKVVDGARAGETAVGTCRGAGRSNAKGDFAARTFCSFSFSKEDSYASVVEEGNEGGALTILGGTGAFAGATGSGTTRFTWGDTIYGDRLTWTAEVHITTP